jgi:uncharacterized protein YecE (DUF72 family)
VNHSVRIGTSGWSYDHWAGVLYRPGLPPGGRLARYVEVFDTVELNASFYRWPTDTTFRGWSQRLPAGFTMTVKAHRGLSHFRRLADPQAWVDRLERCQRALGERREAVLVQLRGDMPRDDARLDTFLGLMPGWVRIAMELRHPSWDHHRVYEILERHKAALVVTDGLGLRCIPRATTDFVYLRMHGPDTDPPYAGSYSPAQLRRWADQIQQWVGAGRKVLVYFNNDGAGNAVRNALELRDLVN